jgi:twitching motility protein PilT
MAAARSRLLLLQIIFAVVLSKPVLPINFASLRCPSSTLCSLKKSIEVKASDIHVTAGSPFRLRIQGRIVPVQGIDMLKPQDTELIAGDLDHSQEGHRENVQKVAEGLRILTVYSLAQVSCFRVNICSQRGSLALVLRTIPS